MNQTRKFVGFRCSWMEGNPQYDPQPVEEKAAAPPPEELKALRQKIAQLAIFMSTPEFAAKTQEEKLEIIMEYTELNSIESGFSRAVKQLEEADSGVEEITPSSPVNIEE